MKRKIISSLLAISMLLGLVACGKTEKAPEAEVGIKEKLLAGVDQLERSQQLYFEDGLTITGMGVNFSGDVTKKTDNYFWKSIEKRPVWIWTFSGKRRRATSPAFPQRC